MKIAERGFLEVARVAAKADGASVGSAVAATSLPASGPR